MGKADAKTGPKHVRATLRETVSFQSIRQAFASSEGLGKKQRCLSLALKCMANARRRTELIGVIGALWR